MAQDEAEGRCCTECGNLYEWGSAFGVRLDKASGAVVDMFCAACSAATYPAEWPPADAPWIAWPD